MAEDIGSVAEEGAEPDNKDLVMQLISDAESGAFMGSSIRIETDCRDGVAPEYIGTVAEIDHPGKMIRINEAQAVEGCPMRAIVEYEWLD